MPQKTQRNKGVYRRLKLLTLVLSLLILWAVATVWDQKSIIKDKAAELNQLQTKLADTAKTNKEVKREINRLNDKEFKDEKARKDLGYSKPGETIFDVPKSKP